MRVMLVLAVALPLAACGGGDGSDPIDAASADGVDAWEMLRDCTSEQAEALWETTCTFGPCHGGGTPAADLDLETAGSLAAMANVESPLCPDHVLVVPGDPESSYLIEKLLPSPRCGGQMPSPGQAMSLEDVDCVRSAIAKMTP